MGKISRIIFVHTGIILAMVSACKAFDTFEHRYLGNQAFKYLQEQIKWVETNPLESDWTQALKELGIFLDNHNTNSEALKDSDYSEYSRRMPLEFGDLPALAGDHTKTDEDLELVLKLLQDDKSSAKKRLLKKNFQDFVPSSIIHTIDEEIKRFVAIRRQWENVCRWLLSQSADPSMPISNLRDCPNQILKPANELLLEKLNDSHLSISNELLLPSSTGYTPGRSELAEFEQLPKYIALAEQNRDHFPRYSWKTYSMYHKKALENARQYAILAATNHCANCIDFLRKAIVSEGFALHFLQDSFSSGHIGSRYYVNYDLLEHTHNTLNHIGLDVKIPKLPDFDILWPNEKRLRNISEIEKTGWTAIGDRHLFTPEAAFHRLVVIQMTTQSLLELWKFSKFPETSDCRMCTDFIFPIPMKLEGFLENQLQGKDPDSNGYPVVDLIPLGNRDYRIPRLFSEGWKLLVGFGTFAGPYEDGGSTFDAKNLTLDHLTKTPEESVVSFELGYLRRTSPKFPNYWGVGYLAAPGVRTSIYPVSIGYWYPREMIDTGGGPLIRKMFPKESSGVRWFVNGAFWGLRLNVGLRQIEALSFQNSDSSPLNVGEATVVGDFGFQIRSPLSIYFRLELLTVTGRDRLINETRVDSPFTNGSGAYMLGVRYDLADVLN